MKDCEVDIQSGALQRLGGPVAATGWFVSGSVRIIPDDTAKAVSID
jgi:hypothetical protein